MNKRFFLWFYTLYCYYNAQLFLLQRLFFKRNKHRTVHKEGFLLIEFMIALSVICAVVVVIAQYQFRTAQWQQETISYMQATTLASTLLDDIIMGKKVLNTAELEHGDFLVSYYTVPLSAAITLPNGFSTRSATECNLVTVNIAWQEYSKTKKSITVSSLVMPNEKKEL